MDSTQAAVYPIGKLTTISENTDISVTVKAESAGEYFADILYTNDEAQSIFGNQCAVRILLVNSHAQGAVVMPQRGPVNGTGYSNPQKISLLRGENKIQLKYIEPQCVNASLTKNSAFIHSLRIIKPR